MTRIYASLTALLFASTGALAATMSDMDTDGDGALSVEEFLTAYTDLGGDAFTASDTNADGLIDAVEFEAAVAAGTLPAPQG